MTDQAKDSLRVGAAIIGMTASIAGIALGLEHQDRVYYQDIQSSSIVVTDDNEGIRYHLAQLNVDNSFNYKYMDILNNKFINNNNIVYTSDAEPYFTKLYEKKDYYCKEDLSKIIDSVCKQNNYATSNEKVNIKIK